MVTVIPEVIEKKCQRSTKSFIRGNVVIMVNVLEKVPFEITEDGSNTTVQDTQDFYSEQRIEITTDIAQ